MITGKIQVEIPKKNGLTGRVFVPHEKFAAQEEGKFQLEAVIDGSITRLEGASDVPALCLRGNGHHLRITAVLETFPPSYQIGCSCGYGNKLYDVNDCYVKFFL